MGDQALVSGRGLVVQARDYSPAVPYTWFSLYGGA